MSDTNNKRLNITTIHSLSFNEMMGCLPPGVKIECVLCLTVFVSSGRGLFESQGTMGSKGWRPNNFFSLIWNGGKTQAAWITPWIFTRKETF